MKIKRGWKCVTTDGWGRLYSHLHPSLPRTAVRRYRINKWVSPKSGCGPLAVFSDRPAALRFCGFPHPRPCLYVEAKTKILGLWYTDMYGDREGRIDLPEGTCLASKVMLKPYK